MVVQDSKRRVALITGVTGQDGAYLAEFLLGKGYTVHGIKRRSSSFNTARIDHLYQDPHAGNVPFLLHYGDMTDSTNLIRLMQQMQPDEIYNLAAQSHVGVSFETPEYTANADAIGTLRLLEAIRILGLEKKTRFYQASTSELYGKVQEVPQKETTPFYPRSPYGVAKLYAYWITVNYREAYGMHASNGILFNHESPIRGETFVTRKITRAVAAIELGLQDTLYLGNLDAKRDWGHARDYVEGMWRMLQQDEPDDYVLATGETHSVREFVELAFAEVGRSIEWRGKGVDENGVDSKIRQDRRADRPAYFRPTEVDLLIGDATKARAEARLEAEDDVRELVTEMVAADLGDRAAGGCQWQRTPFELTGKTRLGRRPSRHGRLGLVRRLAREDASCSRSDARARSARPGRGSAWFDGKAPDAVFLAAAKVGGILANDTLPAEFLYDNLMIETNVIHAAHRRRQEAAVSRLVLHLSAARAAADARGSAADRPLEPTNEWYAIAKIAGIKMCQAYRSQYGCDFISVMPTNLYGPGDNYHPEYSHVVPALIRRFHEAKLTGASDVVVWGTGTPRREFLYVDDLADACVYLMKNYSGDELVNIGTGEDMTIAEFARMVATTSAIPAPSSSIPRGPTARRASCSTSAVSPNWAGARRTSLEDGIRLAYRAHLAEIAMA